jgi:hypothetical protein
MVSFSLDHQRWDIKYDSSSGNACSGVAELLTS